MYNVRAPSIPARLSTTPKLSFIRSHATLTGAVTKLSVGLVPPSEPTPSDALTLSAIDRVAGLRNLVRSLHVFKHGVNPAKVIRPALAKSLVPYYPLAGRLVGAPGAEDVRLECTGEGAWFVEAKADCSLEDVNYLDSPFQMSTDELLPESLPERNPMDLIFMMQVTEFTCGGFVVGLRFVHTAADGLGYGQFVNAIAKLARGMDRPTIKPVWSRELLPNPPKPPLLGPPTFPTMHLQGLGMDVPLDRINQLKAQFLQNTGKRCSTFDLSLAAVWRCRTLAIGFAPDVDVHLCFMANVRHLLYQTLPADGGYYGNCFYPLKVTATSKTVADSSIFQLVKLIKEAKAELPARFANWAQGNFDVDPFELEFNYETLFASDWTQLGLNDVDYGWGKPIRILPFLQAEFMPMCVLGLPAGKKMTGRVETHCVEEEHLAAFRERIMSELA